MASPIHYNELLANLPTASGRLNDAEPRPHSQAYWEWLASQPKAFLSKSRQDADLLFRRTGITFNVYGDDAGTERLIPFDLIPRIIPRAPCASCWSLWPADVYGERPCLKAPNIYCEQLFTQHLG